MKKVSIISLHLGYGGIEKSVCALANMLAGKYEVEIASVYNLYDKRLYYLNDKINIKYLTDIKPNRKEFNAYIKNRRFFKAFIEGIKGLKGLYIRKKSVVNYIKNADSDIIITTRDIFDKWLGNNAKKGVLKIGWEHNHFHGDESIAKNLINSCKKLDYLVVVSNNLKEYYKDKFNKTKVVSIPNTLEDIPKTSSKLTNKRLISVGRLSKEKGYLDLLKVYTLIKKNNPDWSLDIIGDGIEKESLQEYMLENNLTKNVTLHGFREKDYIDKMLDESSIYLMTSYTESFGIVLLEAMSHSVPCVAFSSAEGANEIIENGKNGYLIDNRDFDKYVKKVEELMNDIEKRKKMGKYAKESIKKYESKEIEKLWFNILR